MAIAISDENTWAPTIGALESGDIDDDELGLEDIESDERLLFLERERERGAISVIIVLKKIKLG